MRALAGEEGLIPHSRVTAIVSARDTAIDLVREAIAMIGEGHRLAAEAAEMGMQAHGDAVFHDVDHAKQEAYRRLFADFDVAASYEAFRKNLDARTWIRLIREVGIEELMDRTAKDDLRRDLCGAVPEVTEDAVRDVLGALTGDARLIFQRGLARAFTDLDRRFKSHDGFALGSRVILSRLFDEHGYWSYHNGGRDTLRDIERVFAVLDGNARPDLGALQRAIEVGRGYGHGHGPRQGACETPYFRVRTYINGNGHLWFTRDDLVAKANQMLADYYGEVLPDGVPGGPEADLRQSTRALSRDLAFYPTPDRVTEKVLAHMHVGEDDVVLEPSAGTGNMVRVLLGRGAHVTAIEVDPDRHRALSAIRHPRFRPVLANFLGVPADPRFTRVVMNPPFHGTHWMDHVVHAYGFLRPGGELAAVLPVTADIGTSRKHEEFRTWAKARAERWGMFTDLPDESFAESGTRVSTVVLRLRRPR